LSTQRWELQQWAKQFGGTQSDAAFSNTIDEAGNIYLTGSTDVGSPDFFICKYDTSGSLIWIKIMGGPGTDFVDFITVGDSCNIYITGAFSDSLDFDPESGFFNLVCNNNAGDCFVSKINNGGSLLWANQLHGNNDNIGYSIKLDTYENIYVVGGVSGICDFDPSNNSYNITSAGIYDGYIFKWSQPITGLQDNHTNTLIKVFPNPFAEIIYLNLSGKSTVTISTITGQIISKTDLPQGIHSINLANQVGGTYLLNVLTDKSSGNAVIIKSN